MCHDIFQPAMLVYLTVFLSNMWVSSNTCEGSLNISGSRKKNTQISCPAGKEPVVELTIFRIFLACTKFLFCLCVESFF